ncbi:hypothetical protein [Streptomyces goshikiensis]|nr:hypothetical protein [Streptomyces goshikiensis]
MTTQRLPFPVPDERAHYFVSQYADMHDLVEDLVVPDAVPEAAATVLRTARELLRQSYYCYEFSTVAVMHSLIAVEIALRDCIPGAGKKPLHQLIKQGTHTGAVPAIPKRSAADRRWASPRGAWASHPEHRLAHPGRRLRVGGIGHGHPGLPGEGRLTDDRSPSRRELHGPVTALTCWLTDRGRRIGHSRPADRSRPLLGKPSTRRACPASRSRGGTAPEVVASSSGTRRPGAGRRLLAGRTPEP